MSLYAKNFFYSPVRQGYDASSWKTLSGAPAIASTRLVVNSGGNADIIHYTDFMGGEITFNLNMPAPGANTGRFIGLSNGNVPASKIGFDIATNMVCTTTNGVTSTSSATILWDSAWTTTNTEFKIKRESGIVKFYVAGTLVYQVANTTLPTGPMALYLLDTSTAGMTVGTISVKGAEGLVVNPKPS